MTMKAACTSRFAWLLVANVVVASVLGFYSTLGAAPPTGQPPYANQVEQLDEQIRELREIKELLKEQNDLLRGGTTKVPNAGTAVKKSGLH
jgi:hypothetical protein